MNIKEDIIEEIMKNNIINIGDLDNILIEIPLEIVELIYQYQYPFCNECSNCCNLCKFYCYLECLRFDNRDVCCQGELNSMEYRYNNIEQESDSEEEIENLL